MTKNKEINEQTCIRPKLSMDSIGINKFWTLRHMSTENWKVFTTEMYGW